MLAERNSAKSTAPRIRAITAYQKRESSILVPFPCVSAALRVLVFDPLGDRNRQVDHRASQDESLRRADRNTREIRLQGVLPAGELGNQEHPLGGRVRDRGHVR